MKILIAGAGEVGSHLVKMLGNEYHDITIIDDDEKRLDELTSVSDVLTIEGDVTSFEILTKSEVQRCDLFMAVGPEENTNILSAVLAKQLGARKTIARIDNDEYLRPNNKEVFINMGIDYLFYPEKVAAQEVITLLGHSSTSEYVDFSGGKLSLVVFRLDASSPLVGRTLIEVTRDRENLEYRTVAISRSGKTIIPRGEDLFEEGDMVYVISGRGSIKEVMGLSGKPNIEVRNLMILGGSRIGWRIAKELQHEIDIKLVDYNAEKAYKLAEMLDNTLVIAEDGRKSEVMIEEGLDKMDAFVALTGRSETNILAAMLAKRMGVKKVIAEVENINYISLAESIGIDTIINKKLITASSIFRFTMNTDVQAIKCLNGCDAEVLEFIVKPGSPITKGKIKHINFPREAIVGGVVRGDKAMIATGNVEVKAYDRVVVFALPSAIGKVGAFFG
ncbi:MAG: Trk system potassium transporter TrkA [Rikenella sp.]|nr:Trk system potassium transporter TrkA [Rikenella sp.]